MASTPATTTTITAVPCGRDRHGNPLAPRSYVVDARRENWGDGRTRLFVHRPDLEVGDGTQRFAPVIVRTDSIREFQRRP